jgi:hypothetical protein
LFLICSYDSFASAHEGGGGMGRKPFDRQDWAVVLLGWAVALWITLG